MNNNSNGWKITSAVLAVVVIILLGMMWHSWNKQEQDIDNVLQEGSEDISDVRAKIAAECNGPEGVDAASCQRVLNEFADILEEFTEDVQNADTSEESGVAPQQ